MNGLTSQVFLEMCLASGEPEALIMNLPIESFCQRVSVRARMTVDGMNAEV